MLRHIASLALLAGISSAALAQPTASLIGSSPNPIAFVDWLTVNDATVGVGQVDDNDVVYFLKEKLIGNQQSWLIFFDPSASSSVRGTITFDAQITQLFTSSADVNVASAAYRLTPTVAYGNASDTGLEAIDAASFVGNTLTIDFTASDPGDHVRVLTTVPEPATYALLATGLAVLSAVARRRRHVADGQRAIGAV